MSLIQQNDNDSGTTAPVQESTPRRVGYGHPEYNFIQSIMEMQKSLGEINASIQALRVSVDSTKTKVDDLVKWKHMILGGAVTIGFLAGLALAVFKMLP
jgi:hypothetical protein